MMRQAISPRLAMRILSNGYKKRDKNQVRPHSLEKKKRKKRNSTQYLATRWSGSDGGITPNSQLVNGGKLNLDEVKDKDRSQGCLQKERGNTYRGKSGDILPHGSASSQ